jgi:hypothetical protein
MMLIVRKCLCAHLTYKRHHVRRYSSHASLKGTNQNPCQLDAQYTKHEDRHATLVRDAAADRPHFKNESVTSSTPQGGANPTT